MIGSIRPFSAAVMLLLVVTTARAGEGTDDASARGVETAAIQQLGPEASRALAQVFEYDGSIPLEARVVEKIERDETVREKIVFRGAQGFLVPGYLQYPASGAGPYPCVLLLHGWSGSKESWWQDGGYISGGNVRRALLAKGFAVLALDAQCHGDRIAQNDFAPVNHYIDKSAGGTPRKGYFTQEDIYIQTTRDYRRAIDYLESRPEFDSARVGMIGYSMGGTQTFLLCGVEPRIMAAVSIAAPAEQSKWSPIAPQNFVHGIGKRPFLSIVGSADPMCPVEHAKARQSLLPGKANELMFLNGRHRLPVDYVPHAVGWIDDHL